MTDATPAADQTTAPAVTRLGTSWFRKMVAFLVLLVGFGFWGLYDATILYPNRGVRHASFAKFQYLQLAREKGRLDGLAASSASEQPREEFARLQQGRRDGTLDALGSAKREWFEALGHVGRLTPEFTRIETPGKTLDELTREWTAEGKARAAPKPLAAYDIPVQWLFVVLGLGGGAYLLVHILRVASRKYRWDAGALRLTLPDGSTLTPADLEDVDKRKWDKFIVFLKVKTGHQPHGGKELKLDLYQHDPLESWVLAMEERAFPERAAEEKARAAAKAQADAAQPSA